MSYFTRTSFIYEGGPFKICVHVSNLGVSFIQIAGLHWTPCKTIDGSQQKQYRKPCHIISHRIPIYGVFIYICLNWWVFWRVNIGKYARESSNSLRQEVSHQAQHITQMGASKLQGIHLGFLANRFTRVWISRITWDPRTQSRHFTTCLDFFELPPNKNSQI